jgi:AraC-like DNA-binding protein
MFTASADRAPAAFRSLQAFRTALAEREMQSVVRDGRRVSLGASGGVRHVYDIAIASGGWEFYQLRRGLALVTIDMVTCQYLPRRHSFEDQLVLSAVIEGNVQIHGVNGDRGELATGHCTLYGMDAEGSFETLCAPQRTVKWVSVVIDRALFGEVMQIAPEDLPAPVCDYINNRAPLPYLNVPLSSAASLTAHQILENGYKGSFRRAFLSAKTIELVCLILFTLRSNGNDRLDGGGMDNDDFAKLARAKRYIERSLDEPWTIAELASAVGLTRQKLQTGFRRLYGDTVGQMRDRLRLQRALDLVRTSRLSMIQIALETGYEHPPSFTRAFKAAYGVAPVQMRRMAQEGVLVGHLKLD